jgi:hypothetical protein
LRVNGWGAAFKRYRPNADARENGETDTVCIPESGFFVYAIQAGSFIKIGRSTRLRKRIATYRGHNPVYTLLGVRSFTDAQTMATFEESTHTKFTQDRKTDEKEWFKNSPEIRKAFAEATQGQLIYLNYLTR